MKKRRILAIMMSVIMGIGMLAGCGKKEAEGGSEKTEENSEKKEGTSKKTDYDVVLGSGNRLSGNNEECPL